MSSSSSHQVDDAGQEGDDQSRDGVSADEVVQQQPQAGKAV